MKVLLLNGSPKANGNTAVALHEMVDIFNKEGNGSYSCRQQRHPRMCGMRAMF